MGIAVISNASLNLPGTAASAQAPADSGGADFFALLSQQMAGPQLFGLAGIGAEGLPGMASMTGREQGETDLAQDPNALLPDAGSALAAAGLLPGLMTPANLPHAAANTALPSGHGDEQAGISSILGQLEAGAGKGRTDALGPQADAAISAGNAWQGDTANLAADTQPDSGSGNTPNFAAALAAQVAQPAQTQRESAATAQVTTPLHDARWSQDFGEKIVWLAKNDQQVAQININPPQLGPMHITINLSGDQVSAAFASPHAEVRQAIEDAMPRLREMLAGAGIDLGQSSVGTQLPQQNSPQSQFAAPSRSADDNAILRADIEQGAARPSAAVRSGRGMVDLFA